MKVLLIAPYVERTNNQAADINREDFYPSSALLHLAAILRANKYEPFIVDFNSAAVHKQKDKYLDYCKKIITESLNKLIFHTYCQN